MQREVHKQVYELHEDIDSATGTIILYNADAVDQEITVIRTIFRLWIYPRVVDDDEKWGLVYAINPEGTQIVAQPSLSTGNPYGDNDACPEQEIARWCGTYRTVGTDSLVVTPIEIKEDIKTARKIGPGDKLVLLTRCEATDAYHLSGVVTILYKKA